MKKMTSLFLLLVTFALHVPGYATAAMTCWFPPDWKDQARAKEIVSTLSAKSGVEIETRVAKEYSEILKAFELDKPQLVYVGSFVQSILVSRKLGTPLVQAADGKEMYAGILICPKGQNPEAILKNSPAAIAYAIGASSGESTAKAATGGKAAIGVGNHGAAVKAVLDGKAKAAIVKDWWWQANEKNYTDLTSYNIPKFSMRSNPDKVLSVSKAVSKSLADKIAAAALTSPAAFGPNTAVVPFDASRLSFSISLMKIGGIDPMTYSW